MGYDEPQANPSASLSNAGQKKIENNYSIVWIGKPAVLF